MKKHIQAAALVLPAFVVLPCHAELKPLWEAGIGVATLSLPDYRGSDVRSNYLLPLPYFVYRGKIFKADREGVRASIFQGGRLDVNVSVNATLPVKNNPARSGMADLKPTFEIGPTADVTLWNSDDGKLKLDFRAPVRATVTLEKSPKHLGWLFTPNLNLDIRDPAGMSGWNLGMLTGPIFNSRRYNSYYYSVSPTEANANRPAFDAPGGYSGAHFTAALSKRFERYWVGGFLRYDSLAGAVFADSPLVQKKNTVSAGVGISWVFGASTTLVEAP